MFNNKNTSLKKLTGKKLEQNEGYALDERKLPSVYGQNCSFNFLHLLSDDGVV